ncbi:oligoendopeptidase F [Chlamydia sp. 17-3921]|uniref:oligoendopeptidase F n=1 Tax=Chlamydia sp. 17-3921 TaxID=2675798 RepID=UPI00191AA518|nr:oligoendopeptidase F [Chlamydia sp. 17-3921]
MATETQHKLPPPRQQVSQVDCWDTSLLYSDREAWKQELDLCSSKRECSPIWPELSASQYNVEDPQSLSTLLTHMFAVERQLDKLYTYAHLIHDQDITNQEAVADLRSATYLYTLFSEEISWIQPSLIALSKENITKILAHPSLETYKFYLEKIFRLAPHTGTSNEEKILASSYAALETSSKAFSSLNDSDIPFGQAQDSQKQTHPLSHALSSLYMQSTDRELRRTTYLAQNQRYYDYKNTFANLLNGKVQAHLFISKAKNYDTCLDAALFGNNIPVAVYTNLIDETKKHSHLITKYFSLKKQALGINDFHFYDVFAPISLSQGRSYTYEEGVDLICSSLQPLGKEYVQILRKGLLSDRWVDRYENQNKRSGAYSSGCYDSPPYILLNYSGTLYDVSVIAHEAGHSMHSYFSRNTQSFHNAQYPIFLAEIASTLNEMLLMDALIKADQSKEEKIAILARSLDTIFATIFRQVFFAAFELEIHTAAEKGIPLTEEFLSLTYKNLQNQFYGEVVTFDSLSSIEWARIPHFYYNFYVYQYATGIIAALCFTEKILSHEEGALELYLSFLKSGGSDYPLNILKNSGVDMTTITPIHKAFSFISKQIDALTHLLASN